MEKIEAIEKELAEMKADMEKCVNGNNSAGSRVRKSCQTIKKLCQEIRGNVQEIREKNNKAK